MEIVKLVLTHQEVFTRTEAALLHLQRFPVPFSDFLFVYKFSSEKIAWTGLPFLSQWYWKEKIGAASRCRKAPSWIKMFFFASLEGRGSAVPDGEVAPSVK